MLFGVLIARFLLWVGADVAGVLLRFRGGSVVGTAGVEGAAAAVARAGDVGAGVGVDRASVATTMVVTVSLGDIAGVSFTIASDGFALRATIFGISLNESSLGMTFGCDDVMRRARVSITRSSRLPPRENTDRVLRSHQYSRDSRLLRGDFDRPGLHCQNLRTACPCCSPR